MKYFKILSFFVLLVITSGNAFCQQSSIYQRAADMCEAAAKKYDAKGCPAGAAYCRKMKAWNTCMVNALAGKTGSCGIEPLAENAPKCDPPAVNGNSASSSAVSDPIKELQAKQQQLQQDFDNAQNVSLSAYDNAINSGKKTSGAVLDATLAGAQYINDPQASLAYTGVGLGIALVSWISEKKEAAREEMLRREEADRLQRLEELENIKASLNTSSSVLNFIESTTDYHITNLKIELRHGMVKSILRKDLYDIEARIYDVTNSQDSLYIIEVVKFKNLTTSTDSCIANRVSLSFRFVNEAVLYDGDYTNAYNPASSTDQIFRHKNLTNADIKSAFTVVPLYNEGDAIGKIKSNLYDINISAASDYIKIQRMYLPYMPERLTAVQFEGANTFFTNQYSLVCNADDYNSGKLSNFVDYLNFFKN